MALRLSVKADRPTIRRLERWAAELPLTPRIGPLRVEFQPDLKNHRGILLSGDGHPGIPVFAATFIRNRRIVLESTLRRDLRLLRWIFTHELFHFAWVRLGNPGRREFSALLAREVQKGARGELGESALVAKEQLRADRCPAADDPAWRHYCCEAFCDTAAFLTRKAHAAQGSATLARRWLTERSEWFNKRFPGLLE